MELNNNGTERGNSPSKDNEFFSNKIALIGPELQVMEGDDSSWVSYSEMDKSTYSCLLTSVGVGGSLVTHPFSVITTRQQAGHNLTGDPHYSSVYSAIRGYERTLGWRGLFRGWTPVALMGVPSQLVYLTITEASRELFQKSLRTIFPTMPSAGIDAFQAAGTSIIANTISYIPYVPAEVISSRMMIQGPKGNSVMQTVRTILKENGLRGFYRGFKASLMYGIVLSAQWWWSYSVCRRELSKISYLKSNHFFLDASSGLVAGITSTCIAHPLDTLKTRIMTGVKSRMPLLETFQSIVRAEGLHVLFRGLSANVYQAGITSMGFSISYEAVKKFSLGVVS